MKRCAFLGLLTALASCQAQQHALAPASTPQAAVVRSELCADWRTGLHGPLCLGKLTPEAQSHRQVSLRLEYDGEQVIRSLRINGRGAPEPDDDGCVEHRYRYVQGEIVESTGYTAGGMFCERLSFSEHAQRASFLDEWGRVSLSKDRLFTEERAERDARGLVTRNRVFGPGGSPVTPYGGAHEVRYERDARGFEKRMCLFDEQGRPIENGNRAHCYSYEHDDFGSEIERRAWNLKLEPSEDHGGTHRTVRDVDAFGNVTAAHFFRIDGSPISTEDGHCSSFTYHFDEHGFRTGGDCKDGQNLPFRFREGNAFWRSSPDVFGHIRESRFFGLDGNLVMYEQGYARYEFKRDPAGRLIEARYFQVDGSPGRKDGAPVIRYDYDARGLEVRRTHYDGAGKLKAHQGCAEIDSVYDSLRQLIRSSCKDAAGKLTRDSEGAVVKEWTYDARGLVSEMRFLDENGKPAAQEDGFVRIAYHYDSLGVEHGAQHFALDGKQISVSRFNFLIVRAPHSDKFWPGHSREEALGRIEEAHRELLAGMPFDRALRAYGDSSVNATHPGDIGYQTLKNFYSAAREVAAPLQVGQVSEVMEFPRGFALYQRTE